MVDLLKFTYIKKILSGVITLDYNLVGIHAPTSSGVSGRQMTYHHLLKGVVRHLPESRVFMHPRCVAPAYCCAITPTILLPDLDLC